MVPFSTLPVNATDRIAESTRRWEEKSRFCRRNRLITSISIIGGGLLGTGTLIYSYVSMGKIVGQANSFIGDDPTGENPTGQSFAERLHNANLVVPFALSTASAIANTIGMALFFFKAPKKMDLTDYADHDTARSICDDFSNRPLAEIAAKYELKTENLEKYGFLQPDARRRLDRFIARYKTEKESAEIEAQRKSRASLNTVELNTMQSLAKPLLEAEYVPLAEDPLVLLENEWDCFREQEIVSALPLQTPPC